MILRYGRKRRSFFRWGIGCRRGTGNASRQLIHSFIFPLRIITRAHQEIFRTEVLDRAGDGLVNSLVPGVLAKTKPVSDCHPGFFAGFTKIHALDAGEDEYPVSRQPVPDGFQDIRFLGIVAVEKSVSTLLFNPGRFSHDLGQLFDQSLPFLGCWVHRAIDYAAHSYRKITQAHYQFLAELEVTRASIHNLSSLSTKPSSITSNA